MGQYKRHSAEFKAKVALEAIKGQRVRGQVKVSICGQQKYPSMAN